MSILVQHTTGPPKDFMAPALETERFANVGANPNILGLGFPVGMQRAGAVATGMKGITGPMAF
jgi:hypothetical protein